MKTNWNRTDKLVQQSMKAGLNELGNDVRRRAVVLAPKLTGALRQSAKVDVSSEGETVYISFNTVYARLRHEVNRLHPATRKYLTNALKSIKDVRKYFKSFN